MRSMHRSEYTFNPTSDMKFCPQCGAPLVMDDSRDDACISDEELLYRIAQRCGLLSTLNSIVSEACAEAFYDGAQHQLNFSMGVTGVINT